MKMSWSLTWLSYVGFAVLSLLLAPSSQGGLIWSENFDAVGAVGSTTTLTTSNNALSSISVAVGSGGAVAATPDATFIFSPINGKYLNFVDGSSSTVANANGSFAAISGNYQFDFDFYDATTETSSSRVEYGTRINFYSSLINGSGLPASGQSYNNQNTVMGLQIGNGNIAAIFGNVGGNNLGAGGVDFNPAGEEYSMANPTKHHVTVVGTMGNSTTSYLYGLESLAPRTFDVWLDGVKIGDNLFYRSSSPPSIDRITVRGNSAADVSGLYVDNFTLYDEITLVPEPSTFALLTILGTCLACIHGSNQTAAKRQYVNP